MASLILKIILNGAPGRLSLDFFSVRKEKEGGVGMVEYEVKENMNLVKISEGMSWLTGVTCCGSCDWKQSCQLDSSKTSSTPLFPNFK